MADRERSHAVTGDLAKAGAERRAHITLLPLGAVVFSADCVL
jgi:hypothetical protein